MPTPPQRIDRYEVRPLLGQGTFEAVYRAFDPRLEREVALKVLKPERTGSPQAVERLRDGFALAEEDMRQRGVGEFFGARQHGLGELRFGDLIADADLLGQARRDAIALVMADAGLRRPEHARLRAEVGRRYGKTLELAEVG